MNPPATVRVTTKHIARGWRSHTGRCPVALAICEQWPDATVAVHPWEAEAQDTATFIRYRAALPAEAQDFIEAYDDFGVLADSVEPFEFEVEWIDQDGVGA